MGADTSAATGVHWTLVNQPLSDAVAVVPRNQAAASPNEVFVYGRVQMAVSYSVPGESNRPYQDYSGGLGQATMTWDGRSFQNVTFLPFSQTPTAPAGVDIPPFARPAAATDAAVLASLTNGFHECATIPPPPTDPTIPGCPQTDDTDAQATSARWSFTGNPVQGAIVSFDTDHGNLIATGNYVAVLKYVVQGNPGYYFNGSHTRTTNGKYTATLVWNGRQFQLLKIVES